MESFQFKSKSELRMEGRMREKRGGRGSKLKMKRKHVWNNPKFP